MRSLVWRDGRPKRVQWRDHQTPDRCCVHLTSLERVDDPGDQVSYVVTRSLAAARALVRRVTAPMCAPSYDARGIKCEHICVLQSVEVRALLRSAEPRFIRPSRDFICKAVCPPLASVYSAGSSSVARLPRDRARADSAQALVAQQGQLMQKLTAQRDSVSRVLGDADAFIGKIDSSISRVKGLPGRSRAARGSEGPLEDQVRERKDMLRRVDALVARARETAKRGRGAQGAREAIAGRERPAQGFVVGDRATPRSPTRSRSPI